MRDPETRDFTPEELDLLEDALEFVGDPARRGEIEAMPAPLRERADAYAAILALAREAMPEEDVAPGLLDGVLAEARRAAPEPAPREQGPSWWDRLRRSFLLPGVALAGTAALLLWVARPVEDAPTIHDSAAPAPAAPEPSRPAERAAPAEIADEPADMADGSDVREDSKAAEPAAEAGTPEPVPGQAAPPAAMKPSRSAGGMKAKKAEAEAPRPLPGLDVSEEKRVDADKDLVRDRLESGDAARRKGRCDLAEADYAAVARSNGPAAERARALAGLGLCAEASGRSADAARYIDQALALDPRVEAWLSGEGGKSPKKASTKTKALADGL